MVNEVDVCDACRGEGTVRSQRRVFASESGTGRDLRFEAEARPCEACGARGALDPLASLVRAMALGQTLAWCVVHAPGGEAPMRELWARASANTRLELLVRVHGNDLYLRYADPNQTSAGEFARRLQEAEPPTLEEILAAAKPRGR